MGATPQADTTERSLKAGHFYGELLRKHEGSGLVLSEIRHKHAKKLPRHWHELAAFNLSLDGHYQECGIVPAYRALVTL